MSDNTMDRINRRSDLLNAIIKALSDAVDDLDRPYRWEDIPDVLAEVIEQRNQAWTEIRALNAASRDCDANVTAHADDLHDAGYSAALDDIDAQLDFTANWPKQDRMADLGGWIRGRRAGL